MVVRRSDSRRRRVVVDPAIQSGETPSTLPLPRADKTKSAADASLYAYGADRRNQPKTTDLIPKRVRSFLLVVVAVIVAIGLLNFLSAYASSWVNQISVSGVESLGLTGRATLSSWFSSFLLIASGLASLQIYALRQHRRDDYHGSYRLWLWMSMLLLLGSVNCIVDLTSIAGQLFQSSTNVSFLNTSWFPIAIKLGLLLSLIARGAYEVRESRGSFALVMFVLIAYCGAAFMQLPTAPEIMVGLPQDTILGNCWLLGTAGIFLAELTYARFIYLQAHGLIKPRVVKMKTAKTKVEKTKVKRVAAKKAKSSRSNEESATDSESELDIRSVPAASKSGKKSRSSIQKATASSSTDPTAESEDADSADILKMNKSQLRKQRKQQNKQQQRRAA